MELTLLLLMPHNGLTEMLTVTEITQQEITQMLAQR
jgi:hypothetical protein